MLHLVAEPNREPSPQPYAEAVARLASIRHALRLVEPHGGGPAPDIDNRDPELAGMWERASAAKQRCFDRRSERVIASTAKGLEALLAEGEAGREVNKGASHRLAAEIRRGLDDLSRLMLGGEPGGAQFPDALPFAL